LCVGGGGGGRGKHQKGGASTSEKMRAFVLFALPLLAAESREKVIKKGKMSTAMDRNLLHQTSLKGGEEREGKGFEEEKRGKFRE